jgi:hypothetical protein
LKYRPYQAFAPDLRAAFAENPLGDRPLVGAFELRPGDASHENQADGKHSH